MIIQATKGWQWEDGFGILKWYHPRYSNNCFFDGFITFLQAQVSTISYVHMPNTMGYYATQGLQFFRQLTWEYSRLWLGQHNDSIPAIRKYK